MKHIYTFLCLFLLSGVVSAEQWFCIADKSTGFFYSEETKVWERTTFNIDDSKYIIRKYDKHPDLWPYVVTRVGEGGVYHYCPKDFDWSGTLECYHFNFNKNTLRFINYNVDAYYGSQGEISDTASAATPYIEIGKCSPL